MELNYLAIAIATVAQFIVGAVWYTFIFGKLWGKIHGFENLSKEEQKKAMSSMGPWYGLQFLVTIITTFVLALFIAGFPAEWNIYGIAGFAWLGFVMPTQVSTVIFGGTPAKWVCKKIGVLAGGSLASLLVAAFVLNLF